MVIEEVRMSQHSMLRMLQAKRLCTYVFMLITEFKEGMKHAFEMSDLGLLKFFLGLEIKQTREGLFISQEKYAKGLISKFGLSKCNFEETPMNTSEKLQLEDGADKCNEAVYRSLVGGLIYLTHTRPNLVYAVGIISRFMQYPSKIHYGAARRILKYVAGTINFGLWYERGVEIELSGFADSD